RERRLAQALGEHGREAAEGSADEYGPHAECGNYVEEIVGEVGEAVLLIRCPVAVAMAALVERDHAPAVLVQRRGRVRPGVARLPAAVQQDDGRGARIAELVATKRQAAGAGELDGSGELRGHLDETLLVRPGPCKRCTCRERARRFVDTSVGTWC